jgi:2-polyprenyl-6-methoxyphenol hydroxylase-like FAD-dependent oxidoreductase
MFTDVLICGAGPTGLMLANQLGRRGIRPIIIDRHSGPAQQSRAMAVHARTLEIYAKLGIASRAVELGRPGFAANMWARGKRQARVPFEAMGRNLSAFPYVLMLGQDDNERLMGAHLANWNLAVRWNTELLGLEQQADHVRATIKESDGSTREITAAYVAGCDGSRSVVRDLNGIGFPGAAYEHVFFVADTEAVGPMVQDELNVYLWRDGFHLFFPMRGRDRWRVIGILPEEFSGKPDLKFDDLTPSLRQETGGDLSFKVCDWFSTYRIQHRCTERFRDRRCFLLGDAAHVHSPMGGQGMNTGLQDAYNLAWKLAMVLKDEAGPALLDSYEAERMPVAHNLLGTTDRAFKVMIANSRLASLIRTRVAPRIAALAMRRAAVRTLAFKTISQIGINYRTGPLSRELDGVDARGPRAGDRFPWLKIRCSADGPVEDLFARLDDTRFNLIAIGQVPPGAEAFGVGDLLRVHAIPADGDNARPLADAGLTAPSYYVLRPDGHVGLAGMRLDVDDVARWFAAAHVRGRQLRQDEDRRAS